MNALTVVHQGQSVAYVNPRKAQYAAAKAFLASGSGNKGQFAGIHLSWNGKDGAIIEGFGDNKGECQINTFAVNVANTIRAWRYWPENAKSPQYPYICMPFAGQSLPDHAAANPEGETRYNTLKKADESAYQEQLVLILRDPDSDTLYHLELAGNARSSAMTFLLENLDECQDKPDELPVVSFVKRKVKLDDGSNFMALTMTLEGWTDVTAADNPGSLVEASTEDGDTASAEPEDEPEEQSEAEEPEEPATAPAPRGRAPAVQRVQRGVSAAPAKSPAVKPASVKPVASAVKPVSVKPVASAAKPATFRPASVKPLVGTKIGKRPMKVADDEASED